jgi:protein TonB
MENPPIQVPAVPRSNGDGEGLTRGVLLKGRIVPVFPEGRAKSGQTAAVSLLVRTGSSGQVLEVEVLTPEAHEDFIRAAVAAVRKARFEPALRRGVPVAGQVRVRVEFRLVN